MPVETSEGRRHPNRKLLLSAVTSLYSFYLRVWLHKGELEHCTFNTRAAVELDASFFDKMRFQAIRFSTNNARAYCLENSASIVGHLRLPKPWLSLFSLGRHIASETR
jgi:hypothetical protein